MVGPFFKDARGLSMNRRELLLGSAAALGVTTDAVAAPAAEPTFDAAAVEAKLDRIDRRMSVFRELDFSPHAAQNADEEELFATRNKVSRAAVRSLYFTGAFMEFPEHERAHPGVQDRMARMQPEMDEAIDGMAGYLESLTPADHKNLQEQFKKDPELGMRIGEKLQSVAAEDGMGWERRVDLRTTVDDFSRRMKTQNPGLVFEPFVMKTRKVQANPGTDAEQERMFAVRAGEQAFWDFQQRSTKFVAAWDMAYSARPRIDLAAIDENYPLLDERPEDPARGAKKLLSVGGYLLGAGLASAALGGIFYLISTSSASLSGFVWGAIILGGTIGSLLLIGGLVVLIVGGIIYAVKNK